MWNLLRLTRELLLDSWQCFEFKHFYSWTLQDLLYLHLYLYPKYYAPEVISLNLILILNAWRIFPGWVWKHSRYISIQIPYLKLLPEVLNNILLKILSCIRDKTALESQISKLKLSLEQRDGDDGKYRRSTDVVEQQLREERNNLEVEIRRLKVREKVS